MDHRQDVQNISTSVADEHGEYCTKEDTMLPLRSAAAISIMVKLVNGFCKDVCNLVNLCLSRPPITPIDCVADAGEKRLFVP